jgi:hypothetical protein
VRLGAKDRRSPTIAQPSPDTIAVTIRTAPITFKITIAVI